MGGCGNPWPKPCLEFISEHIIKLIEPFTEAAHRGIEIPLQFDKPLPEGPRNIDFLAVFVGAKSLPLKVLKQR